MSLSAAAIRKMAAKGLTIEDIAEIAEAIEEGFAAPVPTYDVARDRKRAYDRERMREKRSRTMSYDVADDSDDKPLSLAPSPQTPHPHTHTRERTTSRTRKATRRVPDDWQPAETTLARLRAEGFMAGDLERALTRMRDHQFAQAHSDWDAAFRNWVRRDRDRKPKPSHERPDPIDRKRDQLATNFAGAQLALERRALERAGG